MKRVLSILVVVVVLSLMFIGCGASNKSDMMTKSVAPQAAKAEEKKSESFDGEQKAGAANYTMDTMDTAAKPVEQSSEAEKPKADGVNRALAVTGSGVEGKSGFNPILAQRKVIRNANVTVEVDDFDASYGKLKTMIEPYGFVQESNVKKDKVYVNNTEKLITRGIIIIRVDKDKFDSVLSGIKALGLLIDESIKSDDVTDKFFDTESRLRLLKYEESRLEDYLKKINDPDTIFKTESRLTDIRHEIESLTGTLKKWSDLVELSTITINMNEKNPVSNNIIPVKSYSDRLFGGFRGSLKGVVNFFGEFLIVIVTSVPVLIVLGILVWLGIIIYRKTIKSRNNNSSNRDSGM